MGPQDLIGRRVRVRAANQKGERTGEIIEIKSQEEGVFRMNDLFKIKIDRSEFPFSIAPGYHIHKFEDIISFVI